VKWLSWENDDLGVIVEIEKLQQVLLEKYRYNVDRWEILSDDSHDELGDRLREFRKPYAKMDDSPALNREDQKC
jgi:hypothetical protein